MTPGHCDYCLFFFFSFLNLKVILKREVYKVIHPTNIYDISGTVLDARNSSEQKGLAVIELTSQQGKTDNK